MLFKQLLNTYDKICMKLIQILIICGILAGCASSKSTNRNVATIQPSSQFCELVFHTAPRDIKPYLLKKNEEYVIIHGEEGHVVRAKLLEKVTHDTGVVTHKFQLPDDELVEIPNHSILSLSHLENATIPEVRLSAKVLVSAIFDEKKSFFQIRRYPHRTLARIGSVEVAGGLMSSRRLGREIANVTSQIDDHFKKFKLKKPDKTKIVINDNPFFNQQGGPESVISPVFNMWDRESKNVILLSGFGKNTDIIRNPSVIAHERAHSHLFATFDTESFINKDDAIQEAFADFFAAHVFDDPRLGFNVVVPDKPLRDISLRTYLEQDVTRFMEDFDSLTLYGYHDDSLFYSNLLWRVREKVGKENIEPFVGRLMEDLNQNHTAKYADELALAYRGGNNRAIEDAIEKQFVDNFHFFYARLRKLLQETGHEQVTESLMLQIKNELKLDGALLNNYST